MADRTAIDALWEADMCVQSVHRLSESTTEAIRSLLMGPDSRAMRMSVWGLVRAVDEAVSNAMNCINCSAGGVDADFTDDTWSEFHGAVCNAVPAKGVQHGQ